MRVLSCVHIVRGLVLRVGCVCPWGGLSKAGVCLWSVCVDFKKHPPHLTHLRACAIIEDFGNLSRLDMAMLLLGEEGLEVDAAAKRDDPDGATCKAARAARSPAEGCIEARNVARSPRRAQVWASHR